MGPHQIRSAHSKTFQAVMALHLSVLRQAPKSEVRAIAGCEIASLSLYPDRPIFPDELALVLEVWEEARS